MSTRPAPGRSLVAAHPTAALELAVAAMMAATAVGFVRLFDTGAVLVPLLAAVAGSEAIAAAGRRLRLPTVVTALVSIGVLAVVLANRAAPDTTAWSLPTRATGPALAEVARQGLVAFDELRAPVPALEPLVLGAFVGLWVATLVTDWGVVRLRLLVESLVPAASLFLLGTLLGSGAHRGWATVAFAAGIAVLAVVHRAVEVAQRSTWLAVERVRGLRSLVIGGLALGLASLVVGVVVGPRLPGAGSDALWTWRGGDNTRVVVSPFVTIESRLVEQADDELFRVTADEPAYWRTAGLDVYEDGVWQIRGRFSRQDGRLPGQRPNAGTIALVRQTYELSGLAEIWLPAAYAPARVIDAGGPVSWNEDSGTLSVDRDQSENTGVSYTVESAVPRYTVAELRGVDPAVPPAMAADFLALPSDLSPQVGEIARQVTTGQPSRFDQMRALQDWFLSQFSYDTSLSPRQGDPIEQFLTERVGFCQQFAGTFAIMARTLGAPARVAVGFTWGDPDPEVPGSYVVTGRHAHAWPEVWFEGLGWVPFEPTPGRGAPGAEGWTGRPPAQDGVDAAGDEAAAELPPSALEPAPLTPDFSDLVLPEDFLADAGAGSGDATATGDDQAGGGPPGWLLIGLGLAAGWLIGVPAIDAVAAYRRRARSRTPADRVELAWDRANEELSLLGLVRRPTETRLEFAERVSHDRRLRDEAGPGRLAQLATAARFHPAGVAPSAVPEADDHVRRLTRLVHGRISARRRYLRRIDPRRRLRLPGR